MLGHDPILSIDQVVKVLSDEQRPIFWRNRAPDRACFARAAVIPTRCQAGQFTEITGKLESLLASAKVSSKEFAAAYAN